ncbi:MAG: hypothetical protein JWO94_3944 [Verrucomicrobiaceae bacterium]|nr:hypothetical protein [Verrucomicrobiaceae bacterium]
METEPPLLPEGEVTLHHLTGEWQFPERFMGQSTRLLPRFRDVPLLSSIVLTPDLAASLRRSLGYHQTYEGEPMRCFTPRHGLRFGNAGEGDALICLECHLAYFWIDDKELHYALSETAVSGLTTLFRSAEPASGGLDPVQVLHEASFHKPAT